MVDQDRMAMVVLGMHRSGTSAMAGALTASGFQPPLTQMPPQPENPAGYFESAAVAALNDEILAAQDASWDDLFPVDEASLLSNFGVFFLGKAADVLRAEFGDAARIVLKDPRICLLTNVWKRTLTNQGFRTHYVLMIRHPGEVAASLSRRNEFSRDKSLLLWMSSLMSAERKTRGESRSFVLYQDLLADPQAVLDRIETDFGQALPRRTRVAEIEVERIVDSSLRSHAHGDRANRKGELNRLAHLAYDGYRAAARGGQLDQDMLDGVARRLAEIEEVAGGVVSELRLHAHQLNARIQQARSETQAAVGRLATLEPLAAEGGRVEGLRHELDAERAMATALHARVSELTHAAEDAAQTLERQHQAARTEAEALARDRDAEREAGQARGVDLESVRAELSAQSELYRQLQQAHGALAHTLAAEQAHGQTVQARGTELERVLAETHEAHAVQQDAYRKQADVRAAYLEQLLAQTRETQTLEHEGHRTEIAGLIRELEAEQAAARMAEARVSELDGLLEAAREARDGLQMTHQDEFAALMREFEAERDAARAAQARTAELDGLLDAAREAEDRQRTTHQDEIDRLGALVEVERSSAEAASSQAAALTGELSARSQAVNVLERRLLEREASMGASRDAFQTALEVERSESAKTKARLDETVAEFVKVRSGHAETLDQLTIELEAGRSAARLMVGDLETERSAVHAMVVDLVRVTSELELMRREAADLLVHKADAARLEAALADEHDRAAQRLDKELNHSGALVAELASVKEMLAYINTRWWWQLLARARALVG